MTGPRRGPDDSPRIALLHWGDLIEDFLDGLGMSLEEFRTGMSGGWMFGYVGALRRAGVETVLVVVSRSVSEPHETSHVPTGSRLVLVPPTRPYLAARGLLADPLAWTRRDALRGLGRAGKIAGLPARHLAPYLATPARALGRVLRKERCAALLCQEYEHARFDACVALGRLLGIPVFAGFQGGTTQRVGLERALRPLALRACAGLVIGSSAERERVRERYGVPSERIAPVFNPLDVEVWQGADRAEARSELGLSPEARVVAWHGRLDIDHKGLDVLVEALRELRARGVAGVSVLLVGGGRDGEALRKLIAEAELDDVRLVEEYVLDRARLARYLSAGDVYVFPSRREGFPVAPVEAMACGLPVVASDVPGITEILAGGEAGGGLIVPREAPRALADALARVLEDEELRRELSQRARARAESAFSLDAVGAQLRSFFAARGARL